MNKNQSKASAKMAKIRAAERAACVEVAIAKWPEVKADPGLLFMVALYWAEGTKLRKRTISDFRITNSDPGIVKSAMLALHKLGYAGQLYCALRVLPEHDASMCEKAWLSVLGLEIRRVNVVKRRGNSKRIWSEYGVCTLHVARSSRLWLAVMTWIDCWRTEIGQTDSWQRKGD